MKKSSFTKNDRGHWLNAEGQIMHNVTSVKPDKVFLAKFLRCQLRPNEAVLFFRNPSLG